MQENQGVCYWAVQLDGSADPPVVVTVDTAPCEVWLPLAPSFSEFVYCQIWDYAPMSARCEAQEPEFTPETLAFLRSKFQEGPATYGWPGSQNYRFTTPWGRLLIWHADNSGADWFLRASNHGDLEHLLCAVWQCGTLTKTLRGYDHEGEACLQRVRRVKVT